MEIVDTQRPAGALRAPTGLASVTEPHAPVDSRPRGHAAPPASLVWGDLRSDGWYARRGKYALTGALMLACFLPALLICLPIACINWVLFRDPRKILFHQPRVGYRGRVFEIYKFRTMRDAEGADEEARVTRFGRFLRSTHLDELPQLLNILRGEMVFIGPRPEMVEIDEWARERIPGFPTRLAERPGITGLSQITQGYTGMDVDAYTRKLRVDRQYCDDLSFALDCSILARTFVWMLRGRGWSWRGERPDMQRDLTRTEEQPERTAA